jgi:hypothetical protein
MNQQMQDAVRNKIKEFEELKLEPDPYDVAMATADDLLGDGKIGEEEVDLAVHQMQQYVTHVLAEREET